MYNKIFTKILDSSIWLESNPTRIVWLTFLAAMDEDGFAQFASVANLAHRARVELPDCEAAVKCLEGPDGNSSDPENEGRRIERVAGGWIVLNAGKYRELVTRAVAQEKTRERVARFRERKRAESSGNAGVTPANDRVTQSDALSGSESFPILGRQSVDRPPEQPLLLTSELSVEPTAEKIYEAYPKRRHRIAALKAIKLALKRTPSDHLLAKTGAYAEVVGRWLDEHKKFIPDAASWFNAGGYDDDPQTWEKNATPKRNYEDWKEPAATA